MRLSGFRINFKSLALVLALALSLPTALVSVFPTQAFADYSNPSVSTVAQMRTDGSLHVVEQRSYDFQEDYSAVTWNFTGITDKQEVEVASVRAIQMDAEGNIVRDWNQLPEVAFQSSWRDFLDETGGEADKVAQAEEALSRQKDSSDAIELPKADTYAFDKRRGELYVFLESTENSTVIECDYSLTNAALIYDDTAEMYWDYVPAQPDVEMSNVRTQIQLPVPEGVEVVPGENVRAWGHGPEGEVEVRPDGTVHYFVPEVREGQYAQAHLLFPRSWLTNINVRSKLAKSGTRYDDAVREESSWTDTYSWGMVNSYSLSLALHALCALALLGAVAAYAIWGRERRPEECEGAAQGRSAEDAAERDMGRVAKCPEECDAEQAADVAVIGRLLRWNQHSAVDFAATLAQLQQRGVISILQDGDSVGDVRFRITPSAKSATLSKVEQEAMVLLFDVVGDGYQSVSLGEVQRFCSEHPGWAREAMAKWQNVLSDEVEAEHLFDARSRKASRWLYGVGVAFAALAVWQLAGPGNLPMAGALLATGVVVAAIGHCTPRRTPKGVLLAECAEAEAREACGDPAVEQGVPVDWETALANAFGDALVA